VYGPSGAPLAVILNAAKDLGAGWAVDLARSPVRVVAPASLPVVVAGSALRPSLRLCPELHALQKLAERALKPVERRSRDGVADHEHLQIPRDATSQDPLA